MKGLAFYTQWFDHSFKLPRWCIGLFFSNGYKKTMRFETEEEQKKCIKKIEENIK